jgi:hypothetical protein
MQNYDLFLWHHQFFYEHNRSKSENTKHSNNTKWETHQKRLSAYSVIILSFITQSAIYAVCFCGKYQKPNDTMVNVVVP